MDASEGAWPPESGLRPDGHPPPDRAPAVRPFNRWLDDAIVGTGSMVCVGLDPHPGAFDGDPADFCRRVIDVTIESVVAYKPNIAFFETLGAEGLAALRTVIAHVGDERVVVLDAKRGDIGSTASAYASAAFGTLGAHAVTVNPYLGGDAVAPFLARPERGAFVLCHTSNPGAADLQTLVVEGEPLYTHVARLVASWNAARNVGLVVGATFPEALLRARALAGELPILVPGVGAQGGDVIDAVRAGVDANGRGLLVNSSRGIIFARDPADAANRLRDRINEARP